MRQLVPYRREEFEALIQGAQILEADTRGPKVYETPAGQIVKLFRIKRFFSSNLLCPLALRFARNAARLEELHIACLRVTRVGRLPHLARQFVIYDKLPGRSLRHVLRAAGPDAAEAMRQAGGFIGQVHEAGVYFRSFHFGNILATDDGRMALIDVLDTFFHRKPLTTQQRRRNFRHMIRYAEDREAFAGHWQPFADAYTATVLGGKSGIGRADLANLLAAHRQDIQIRVVRR